MHRLTHRPHRSPKPHAGSPRPTPRPGPAFLALGFTLAALQCPAAAIHRVGDLPGGLGYSWASDISADGSTVVGYSESALGRQAFRWSLFTGIEGLGFLDPAGFRESYGSGVSADGSVVVGTSRIGGTQQAFRWTSGGGMESLGTFPGQSHTSAGTAVSADGSVVAGVARNASSTDTMFRWTAGTGMVDLGSSSGLPPGTPSEAFAVSADGSKVFGMSALAPARWRDGIGMESLGPLPGGSTTGRTWGASADGTHAVGIRIVSPTQSEGFLWTEGVGTTPLGYLEPADPGSYSEGVDVSDDGNLVVGFSTSTDPTDTAFLWTPGLGMLSLSHVLEGLGVDLAEWDSFGTVSAVSDNGRYLAGTGVRLGQTEAFRIDLGLNWESSFQNAGAVPEPSTYAAALTVSVLAGGTWLRRRRQQPPNHA